MNLKILLPAEVFLTEEVTKVVAEAENGFFCLLPQHVDFTAALVPGVFLYATEEEENYLAIDVGTLVKKGDEILVSDAQCRQGSGTRRAQEGGRQSSSGKSMNAKKRPVPPRRSWKSISCAASWN